MHRLSMLRTYGMLFFVFVIIAGVGPCKMINFYNNLTLGGKNFTAKLVCQGGATFEAYTGQMSACQSVTAQYCNCKLYADNEEIGTFDGCIDITQYCPSTDATLILDLDGNTPGLFYQCVSTCGSALTQPGDFGAIDSITSLMPVIENGKVVFDVYQGE